MKSKPPELPQRGRFKPLLTLSAAAALLATPGCAVWRLSRAAELARRSRPYEQHPATAARHLLVVGDSTAVGTGASAPIHSLAGLIGQAHPRLDIVNRAEDGARMAALPQQMQGAAACDMVLIQAGGNDVFRLRDLDALQADVDNAVRRARELAPLVVLMPCGNVGNAPFFFAPLSWWMTRRARALQRFCADSAQRHGARYVNLFRERGEDPFVRDRSLNASDGLHPSDAGYRVWWQELQDQADLAPVLTAARPALAYRRAALPSMR